MNPQVQGTLVGDSLVLHTTYRKVISGIRETRIVKCNLFARKCNLFARKCNLYARKYII